MGKRLIIMRHAKSSWAQAGQADHERPLNKRGQRDAPHLGALLADRGWIPEHVYSSDSQRTRETLDGVLGAFDDAPTVEFTSALYLGGASDIADCLMGAEDAWRSVLVLGHNPGFSYAVHAFAGVDVELKTAHAALLECEAETWAESCGPRPAWKLVGVLTPHDD